MAKRENKTKKSTKGERENFAWATISHQCENSHQCEIFAQGCEKLRSAHLLFFFCSSFALDFKSVKLVLARIRCAWIDSTNSALKACKNYKISHKMRSVE